MADSIKINKSFVDRAEKPVGKDQIFYRDKELKGFALRVTSAGTKSFVVEKIIGKKVRRITLGKYGSLTAESARTKAKILLGQIASGGDPIADKQATKMRTVSLREVYAYYLKTRKSLKPKTIYDYNRVVNTALAHWLKNLLPLLPKIR